MPNPEKPAAGVRLGLSWTAMLSKLHREAFVEGVVLALDPGGTTGWAVFRDGKFEDSGQVEGSGESVRKLLAMYGPHVVVCEDYLIYPWMAKQHVLSRVPVAKLIGRIEDQCEARGVPVVLQTAREGKGFVTDKKLVRWKMFARGKVHANDATRHGAYYLLFGKETSAGRRKARVAP